MDIKLGPESLSSKREDFWINLLLMAFFVFLVAIGFHVDFFWEPCTFATCFSLVFFNVFFYLFGFLIKDPLAKKIVATIDFMVARLKGIAIICAFAVVYFNLIAIGVPKREFWIFAFLGLVLSAKSIFHAVKEVGSLALWFKDKRDREAKLARALEEGSIDEVEAEAEAPIRSPPFGAIFDPEKISAGENSEE